MNSNESLWAGPFGTDYHKRNESQNRTAFWEKVLFNTCVDRYIHSAIELGAGQGDNLLALRTLGIKNVTGVEINPSACDKMRDYKIDVVESSVTDIDAVPPMSFDLVLTRGFLIHVPPEDLDKVYRKMANLAHSYIAIAEYYSPSPREVHYRGNDHALWARDFAGEFLEQYPYFRLVTYGFVWHHDRYDPQDDITWFLLERWA